MKLEDVFPREAISAAAPGAKFEAWDLTSFEAFAEREPHTAMGYGFAAWDHALSSEKHAALDPFCLAGPINAGDPLLIRHVEAALGTPAILDFHHVAATLEGQPDPFAALSLAHLYPNHLHIGDVLLLDPAKPRPDPDVDRPFESLRMMPAVLARVREAALSIGAEAITLTAANVPLRKLFEQHGFRIAGKMVEAAGAGHSFPMTLPLR